MLVGNKSELADKRVVDFAVGKVPYMNKIVM